MENRNALIIDEDEKEVNNCLFADRIISVVELIKGSKVLEVGCGGAELSMALAERYGMDCYGIEPYPLYAPRIAHDRVKQGVAENIPFADSSFDLVIAKDVLEHVDDVATSLSELIRVSRKYVYIVGPNYLHPYEAHFKVPFPPKLPKILARWYLRLLGFAEEKASFINHIQYVTKLMFRRIIIHSRWSDQILAVVDLQLSKGFRRGYFFAPLLDLFFNYKVELLIIKKKTSPVDGHDDL